MNLLLDAHTFIWWVDNGEQLSPQARNAIESDVNEIYVSAVTGYEIASKVRARKLRFDVRRLENFADAIASFGFAGLPISLAHACRAGLLPVVHKDPFDRLLAAQCELEGLTLVTREPAFGSLGIRTIW